MKETSVNTSSYDFESVGFDHWYCCCDLLFANQSMRLKKMKIQSTVWMFMIWNIRERKCEQG